MGQLVLDCFEDLAPSATLQNVVPHALLAADDPLAHRERVDLRALCKAPLVFTR